MSAGDNPGDSFTEGLYPKMPLNYTDTNATLTYTTYSNEGSPLSGLARAIFQGDPNLLEGYFSVRRVVDFLAVVADWAPLYGLNVYHKNKALDNVHVIEFIAENGVIAGKLLRQDLPIKPVWLKGWNHMDPLFASANTNYRYDADVIGMLLDWAAHSVN